MTFRDGGINGAERRPPHAVFLLTTQTSVYAKAPPPGSRFTFHVSIPALRAFDPMKHRRGTFLKQRAINPKDNQAVASIRHLVGLFGRVGNPSQGNRAL